VGSCRRPRSSTTCGTTPSAATGASRWPTSGTCAASSRRPGPASSTRCAGWGTRCGSRPEVSLRARLLLGMAVVAAVLVVSALAITRSTRDHLLGQVDDQLRAAIPRVGDDPARQALAPRLSELYVGRVTTDGRHVAVLLPDLEGEGAPLPQIDAGDVDRLARGAIITVPSDGDTRYRLAG